MVKPRPWLWLPPKVAHDLAQTALPSYARIFGSEKLNSFHPVRWNNLNFPNPVGIAGGVDKSGKNLLAWQSLGAGFLEVGTITPQAQKANPGTIIDRNIKTESLWNKMGFPNPGSEKVFAQLDKIQSQIKVPLFVNIGKNRNTENKDAAQDYIQLIKKFDKHADAFVVNISSPNTKGLRSLLKPEHLKEFLLNIFCSNPTNKAWFLKISPDLSEAELLQVLDQSCQLNCGGFILTNTLQNHAELFLQHEGGGVSGQALKDRSKKLLAISAQHLTRLGFSDKLLISAGGINSVQDIKDRLNMGAQLVQVYSALVFHGPDFFRDMARMWTWQSKEKKDHNGSLSSPEF